MKIASHQKTLGALALFTVLPMAAQAASLVWDNGGTGSGFHTADNWNPNQSPSSGNDSIDFTTSTDNVIVTTEFTIGNGQTMSTDAGTVLRIGNGGNLTLSTGGTFDFATGGNGIFAESGVTNQRFTIEAGATARAYRFFNSAGWTTEFVANSAGVTTFEITNLLYVRPGILEVDLTQYDISNGDTLVLFDYANLNTNEGVFSSVILSPGWTADIDFAYDQGGGDLGIALTNIVIPEPSSTALLGLGGLALALRRRR